MNNDPVRFASGMNIFLALWQIFSPFTLAYTVNKPALWDGLIVGVITFVLAWYRTLRPSSSMIPGWINLLLGAWLAVSPLALGFTYVASAMWNDITLGIAVAFFAIVGLLMTSRAPTA